MVAANNGMKLSMKEIQSACAGLAGHPESYVSKLALLIADADLKRDVEHENKIVGMEVSLSTMSAKLKVREVDNRRLKAQNNKFRDMLFGPSSEKSDGVDDKPDAEDPDPVDTPPPKRGEPNLAGAVARPEEKPEKRPRGMRGKQKIEIPKHLPRDIRIIEPIGESTCSCGCGLRKIGEQIIERLTYKPAEVRVIEERYPKYTCRSCDRFVQAPVPKRAFDYTRFDDRMIAGLAVGKFADFLPNYRQEEIFKRAGVMFHRSTMSNLMTKAGDALLPIHEALDFHLKSSSKLFMDETTMPQLLPGNGRTKTCWAWALCRDDRRWVGNAPPGVAFYFCQSRKGEHADQILKGYNGILQVDGYGGYNGLTKADRDGGPISLAFCWAHVRRKFLDVYKATKSVKANDVVALINKMYAIESDLTKQKQPADVRLATRQAETVPLMNELGDMLGMISGQIAAKSTLNDAIKYTLKRFDGLSIFLADGRVEMDNNPVENTIRPIALLRKNALFAGSEIGGRNWAVMASLVATCKLNGVEPYAYFVWVFEQMAKGHPRSEYDMLLPWHCPKGRFGIE